VIERLVNHETGSLAKSRRARVTPQNPLRRHPAAHDAVAAVQRPDAQTTTFGYDTGGRLSTVTFSRGVDLIRIGGHVGYVA